MNMESRTERESNYPYLMNFISMVLIFLYTAFMMMIPHPMLAIVVFLMAGFYLWAMYKTKMDYFDGKVSRGRVTFVAIGGLFLVFFANFLLCTIVIM